MKLKGAGAVLVAACLAVVYVLGRERAAHRELERLDCWLIHGSRR